MSPRICIVTPSFNQGRFIDRTVRSVLSQDIPGLEYVVMDGGSTDETLDVLRRYDSRIRWVSEKDNGQADAVNKGIRATGGDIIGWLNSDDVYYPGALRTVLDLFENHPDTEVVYGDADHIDEDDNVIEPYYTEDWDYERLKEVCFLCQPAVFFSRAIVERLGALDESLRYCMDYEYWLRLGAAAPFARIPSKLAGSRMYRENKTMGSRVAVHKEMNDMFGERFGGVPARWIYNYAHAVVDQAGYDRAIPSQNMKYVIRLAARSFGSFLRWNHKIPSAEVKTLYDWVLGAAKGCFGGQQ